ncbi:hypothetical protein RJ639_032928 [Escallonia herrerae]|uniref:Outer envelope pore protein 37, chloroplastic n=1 Tax=Escallonia herrerae TaxID=1293975 RepID=A0AA89BB81_9ASTE|nr:hypothetical protein RJ639_032928 [Escallonia herrerae]
MVESAPPSPILTDNPPPPPLQLTAPPPPSQGAGAGVLSLYHRRPAVRVTSEFDSDSSAFFHKISCKFFDNLAKLKLSFNNNNKGEVAEPRLDFSSKHLSLHYDFEEQNALVNGSFDLAPGLHLKATRDVKVRTIALRYSQKGWMQQGESSLMALRNLQIFCRAQQGEVAMIADLAGPAYKLEVSTLVPSVGLVRIISALSLENACSFTFGPIVGKFVVVLRIPKATLKFPLGEISIEEKEVEDEVKRMFSISGILKSQVLNGVCTAQYSDENLNLRYLYKDDQMAFIPSISLPSNALKFAFKRRFGPSDKLSYWYNFDSNYWSAVYKHTLGKDYKLKAGYDSEVRLGWASLWVGDEAGQAKTAPMKMKVQFMLQVPQDDIKSSALMFRVKKRWDI